MMSSGPKKPTLTPCRSAPSLSRSSTTGQRGDIKSYCSVSECPICRTLLEVYAASLIADKTQISPFDRLVAQDFVPPRELGGGIRFCRFHSLYKKRYDILSFINQGLTKNLRYEELYNTLSEMDKLDTKSVEWLLGDIKEEILSRQLITRAEVRNSLIREAKRLTDLWGAQIEDLDSQIAYSIGDLQKRQAQELAFCFENIEKQYSTKRPHFSSALLELFQQEPRMCRARAFNEALRVVDAGKQLERIQTMRFRREVEREKSLKLSWEVCKQTRLINGVVEKMSRHRRKEEASREIDRSRLKSRVKTALQRLEKTQRQALVVMRSPFLQHIYRVRHLVELNSKVENQIANAQGTKVERKKSSLYEEPTNVTFRTRDTDDAGRDVRTIASFPECSTEFFYTMIMGQKLEEKLVDDHNITDGSIGPGDNTVVCVGNRPDTAPSNYTSSGSSSRKGLKKGKGKSGGTGKKLPILIGGEMKGSTSSISTRRPKSAPGGKDTIIDSMGQTGGTTIYNPFGQERTGAQCDWCGMYSTTPIELELEKDLPASVQRALSSTEFANVALQTPTLDTMLPGPRGIPDIPDGKVKRGTEASLENLKNILREQEERGGCRIVCRCCSFKCMYQWNNKHSPNYLRSRRHLQIDLMQSQKKEEFDEL